MISIIIVDIFFNLNNNTICVIICELEGEDMKVDENNILDVIEQRGISTSSFWLENLLLSIPSEDERIAAMEKIEHLLHPNTLMYIIVRIDDNDKRIKVFDRYIKNFGIQQFMYMLFCLDDEKQEEFLDNHIAYFDESSIKTIFKETYKMRYHGINRDRLLNKYIDMFDTMSIYLILLDLNSYEYDMETAVEYLISKTNNEETIQRILDAMHKMYPDYTCKVKHK